LDTFIGFGMPIMWIATGWVAGTFGWRAAFRYPVLCIGFMSLMLWWLIRDKPSDAGVPTIVGLTPDLGGGDGVGESVGSTDQLSPVVKVRSGLGTRPYSPCLPGSGVGWFKSAQYNPSCRIDSVNCSKSTGLTM